MLKTFCRARHATGWISNTSYSVNVGVSLRETESLRGVLDNVFIERLRWSVKYESIYLHEFSTVPALEQGLQTYFDFYCHQRPHQALDYRTPGKVYGRRKPKS